MEEKETKKKSSAKAAKSTTTKTKSATKKATTQKESTTSKNTTKKKTTTSNSRKVSTKKSATTSTPTKKSSTVKTATKKKNVSTFPKKEVEKESNLQTKQIDSKVDKISKEEEKDLLLEKTIIFDGLQNKNINDVVSKLEEDKVVLEDKVIQRSKGRKVIIIILVIAMIAVCALTTMYVVNDVIETKRNKETLNSNVYNKASEKYKSEEEIKESENSNIIKDIEYDNIETITLSEFEKKALNKEDMIVLVASTTCYSCITFEPVIDEVFDDLGKTIYRLNINSMPKEDVTRFRTYYAFKATPTIFVIKDGIVTSDVRGAMNEENLRKWLDENL